MAEAGADSRSVTSKLCLEARMSEAATPTGPEPTTMAFWRGCCWRALMVPLVMMVSSSRSRWSVFMLADNAFCFFVSI